MGRVEPARGRAPADRDLLGMRVIRECPIDDEGCLPITSTDAIAMTLRMVEPLRCI